MPNVTFVTGQGSVAALAAGVTIDNLLLGSQWMYVPGPTELYIALVADGGAIGDVLATISSGTDMLAEEQAVSNINRFPVWPDDFVYNDVAAAGDLIKIRVRTKSATARVLTCVLRLNPL